MRTIEEEVSRALEVLLRSSVALTVAGRTDAGVHALGQVVSYAGEPVPVSGLNALLPDDVAALACERAPEGFDARRDATSRAYCYRLLMRPGRGALERGRVLHWPHRLDYSALEECAAALLGTRDFTAFTPTETEHVRFQRDVYAAFWRRRRAGPDAAFWGQRRAGPEAAFWGQRRSGPEARWGELVEFWIEADAFMRHMNRVLVGTMLEVARGARPVSSFASLLSGRPRSEAGPTAPAHGLYLAGVGYGGDRVLV